MENLLLKGVLYGLLIYGLLLILYVEFRGRKHTDYPSGVKTISLGLLLIIVVISYNLHNSDLINGPLDYGTLLAGLLIILSNARIFRFLEKRTLHIKLILNRFSRIKIKKYLLLITLLSVIIVGLQYSYNIPLKMGEDADFYGHLACVIEIAKGQIPPHSALTTENVPTEHYGPYIIMLGYVYAFTHINPIILFYLAGIVNVVLFIFFSFKLIKEFFGERVALFSVFGMLFLWGVGTTWAGVYSVADGYDYFYPQGVAYTLMFASFYFLVKARHNHKYMVYCLLSSFLLFTTHLLTGFFYFFAIYLYSIIDYLQEKAINRYHIFVFSTPIIIFLLSLLWPYYSIGFLMKDMLIPIFSNSSPSAVSSVVVDTVKPKLGITDYPFVGGVAIIGVIGLWRIFKSKQFFFPVLFFCSLAILTFGLLPASHRFLFFSMIPLHIGFGILIDGWYKELKELNSAPKNTLVVVIVIITLLFSVFSVSHKILMQNNMEPINVKFIEDHTNPHAVILTDDLTGFAIPGLTGRKIVALLPSHGEMFITDKNERNIAMKTFFDINSTEQTRTKILKHYNVSYVVINKEIMDIRLPYLVEYEDNKYLLYDVIFPYYD